MRNYKKIHFRGVNNNREQTITSSLMSQHHPFTSPAPRITCIYESTYSDDKSICRDTQKCPYLCLWLKVSARYPHFSLEIVRWFFCIVRRREMRLFALPFHWRTENGCVSASSRSTCMKRHRRSAAQCARSPPGSGYRREMRARSVEHLTNHPARALRLPTSPTTG